MKIQFVLHTGAKHSIDIHILKHCKCLFYSSLNTLLNSKVFDVQTQCQLQFLTLFSLNCSIRYLNKTLFKQNDQIAVQQSLLDSSQNNQTFICRTQTYQDLYLFFRSILYGSEFTAVQIIDQKLFSEEDDETIILKFLETQGLLTGQNIQVIKQISLKLFENQQQDNNNFSDNMNFIQETDTIGVMTNIEVSDLIRYSSVYVQTRSNASRISPCIIKKLGCDCKALRQLSYCSTGFGDKLYTTFCDLSTDEYIMQNIQHAIIINTNSSEESYYLCDQQNQNGSLQDGIDFIVLKDDQIYLLATHTDLCVIIAQQSNNCSIDKYIKTKNKGVFQINFV